MTPEFQQVQGGIHDGVNGEVHGRVHRETRWGHTHRYMLDYTVEYTEGTYTHIHRRWTTQLTTRWRNGRSTPHTMRVQNWRFQLLSDDCAFAKIYELQAEPKEVQLFSPMALLLLFLEETSNFSSTGSLIDSYPNRPNGLAGDSLAGFPTPAVV